MKVVLLAGGMGTRIGEESQFKPKPMIEIGERPILWHIMKRYSLFGFNDFVICCGYKGYMIKEYFVNYYKKYSDVIANLDDRSYAFSNQQVESWKVTMVNTGLHTLTAGRILAIRNYVKEEPFLLTYGDGIADIDIDKLISFHNENKKTVTITVTKPSGRFGIAQIDEDTRLIKGFKEKSRDDQYYVNSGFMICEPTIFDYLGDGTEMLEQGPFSKLIEAGEMDAYQHEGLWLPMDSLKDKKILEDIWSSGTAPWIDRS